MVLFSIVLFILLSGFVGASKMEDNMKTSYFVIASIILLAVVLLSLFL